MEYADTYFEDEVREGFYIPSLMKRAWAAQMEVLEMVQKICENHQIRYFAEWGTLLGAVRHGGRIPWDDDIDICMLRQDYDRFREVVKDDLPEECMFFDYYNVDGFDNMLGRIINSKVHVLEGKNLAKYHGFPYVAGIDIFWLDSLPADSDAEEQYYKELCAHLDRKTLAIVQGDDIKEVTNLYIWLENRNYRLPKKCYDESILLPFENARIRVPAGYDELLFKKYGANWMKSVRSGGLHDYPSYAKQQKFLEEEQAAELFEYRFSQREMEEVRAARLPKDTLQQKVKDFIPLFQTAHKEICEGIKKGDFDAAIQILGECQQTAIQIGTLIEQEQGEGHPVVRELEQYCEFIFHIHTKIGKRMFVQKEEFADVSYKELTDFTDELSRHIEYELKERKEVVFVPYKATLWSSMESVWQAAVAEEDTDVYVVPAPFYYKDAYGIAKTEEPHYETEGYPENVMVTFYEDYNFQEHHPDIIVIQCPYDEYNYGMTLHPFFYAKNLAKYTDRLVYIPAFVMDEIGSEDHRARETLKSYCNMPGVVHADQVIVQSGQMKNVYVELLTEFAGETTRPVWEKKIVGIGSPVYDQNTVQRENMALPGEWRQIIERPDGSWKKIILYNTSASAVLHYGQAKLDKMQEVLYTFQKNQADIALLWLPDSEAGQILQDTAPGLWEQYQNLIQEYCNGGWGIYADSSEAEQAVQICDACYGDGGSIVNRCRNMGKVVRTEDMLI